MLVLGARLQMLNSVGIGLFSLNSFISWKGKKFNTKENEWFSAMIALNIHRPEAHLEIRGFNASGFVCLFVLFSHWQNSQKKKKTRIYFLLGGQKERPGSPRPPRETCSEKSRPLVLLPGRAPVGLAPGSVLCAQEWPCAAPMEGTGVSLKRNTHATCPMLG